MHMREIHEQHRPGGAEQHNCSLHKLSKGMKGGYEGGEGLLCCLIHLSLSVLSRLFQAQYMCQG